MGKDIKTGVAINSNTFPSHLTPPLSRTIVPLLFSLLFLKHLFFSVLKHPKSLHLSPPLADNGLNLPKLIKEIRRELHPPATIFTSWLTPVLIYFNFQFVTMSALSLFQSIANPSTYIMHFTPTGIRICSHNFYCLLIFFLSHLHFLHSLLCGSLSLSLSLFY